jgi:hypothetical protein
MNAIKQLPAAYVQKLEIDFNFQVCIYWRQLPYSEAQLRRRYRKPFRAYWLEPETIDQLGAGGQLFADAALAHFDVDISQFNSAQPTKTGELI